VEGPFWDDIRALIGDWFSRLCADAQKDVRARLRSSDDRQFLGAFLELYLHESLVQAGYAVTCHPEVSGQRRRPDFLAEKDGSSFYLEARFVSPSHSETVAGRRLATVYDALNTLDSPNFFLGVEVNGQGVLDLRTRPLRNDLSAWLDGLDPDALGAVIERDGLSGLPVFPWEADGWSLAFRPLPKAAGSRGSGTGLRPIGLYGAGNAYWVDDTTPLRATLSDKGKAYGSLDRPFVVAVGTNSTSTDDWDVTNALYGAQGVQLGTTSSGESVTRTVRAPDGYWYGGDEWRHRSVSGVLVVRGLFPGSVGTMIPTLWEHPSPTHAFRTPPMWRRAVRGDTKIDYVGETVSPATLFSLPTPWPTGERFPT
jgi:hypothetical protein